MNSIFSSCLQSNVDQHQHRLDTIHPQPLKYRLANALNIFNLAVKNLAEPGKREKYTFPRGCLRFLTAQHSHVPILYYPAVQPESSTILVYCHGSSSNLNNIYEFANGIIMKYNIAFLAYDYTGDGQSQKSFYSFQEDLKLVLAWVLTEGYKLTRTILCGFSLGSYSALAFPGVMPRLLISPICGIISFMEGEAKRYQREKYDTTQKALNIKSRALIVHCAEEMVHISHGELLTQALRKDNEQQVVFHKITDNRFEHRSAPSYLCSSGGQEVMKPFLKRIAQQDRKQLDKETAQLQQQILKIVFFHSQHSEMEHLQLAQHK